MPSALALSPGDAARSARRRARDAFRGTRSRVGHPRKEEAEVVSTAGGSAAVRVSSTPAEAEEEEEEAEAEADGTIADYLDSFGFAAADAQSWLDLPLDEVPEGLARSGPWLGFGIAEHAEANGHTWYQVECSIAPHGARTVEWQAARRLSHLRSWHDRVKKAMGRAEYRRLFGEAPFAQRGGRKGTSARLHEWCTCLAACINAGHVPPSVVALTLRFVRAPNAERQAELLKAQEFAGNALDIADGDCCRSTASVSTRCSSGAFVFDIDEDEEGDEAYESDFEADSGSSGEEDE
mmetsp:Transcript_27678/g.76586  ORF Transcript_27678/g.76586 Transcript_27678/m.76586 type:complete len:294 (-) Transcript_27678:302-1183(-)